MSAFHTLITSTFESQKSVRLLKSANDDHPNFDSIYSVLMVQIEKARRTSPIYEGSYDPRGLVNEPNPLGGN
jgi:hypothetical protein